MAGFRCRKDTLGACEHLCCLEHFRLLYGDRSHVAVVIQLGEDRTHAVEAKTAGVICRRNEIVAECVHLGKRCDHTGVAEVIDIFPSCEARAGCRFDCHDVVVCFSAELLAHERGNQTAEV